MVLKFYCDRVSPPCRVVLMALRHLAVEFEERKVALWEKEQFQEDFIKINPRHKLPVIQDGEFILTESRAILQYLGNVYGDKCATFYPRDARKRARVDEVLQRDMENFHLLYAYMNNKAVFTLQAGPNEKAQDGAIGVLKEYDGLLQNRDYIAGEELTIADISAYANTSMIERVGFKDWEDFPNLLAWRRKIESLPYYQECWPQYQEKVVTFYQQQLKKIQQK